MSKPTQSYFETLNAVHAELAETYAILNVKQSELDREVSAISHEIERMDLDLEDGYGVATRLQETLRRRRVVKDEHKRVSLLIRGLTQLSVDYRKNEAKSKRICRELNVTMTIADVM
ncbi:hypothetical protein [Paenibacillus sp. ACRRY]|uniref:hypothetical protein n=1 Tax=Paenibacillus sp. ACRRY TaxID=2918208 RepID=UPI001EF5E195|nr:hypothetical protein [Paenibacillus sp. ACRRY]MCG7386846.1 hypothetical protein [Paenibacillus sp. ACRRY]